jgi:cytidine deaminase
MDDLEFTCPRCGTAAHEVFYGPCGACRQTLRALGGERREAERIDYEPKMNVTPNAVAVKDD